MKFKLMAGEEIIYEGTSLIQLMRELWGGRVSSNQMVEIYQKTRVQWRLVDGGVFPFGVSLQSSSKSGVL